MTGHPTSRHGDGTAWLVVDPQRGGYLCYWYAGTNDGRLLDHARVASAADAVAWGRQRTPNVRIRTPEASSWAGTGPRPAKFTHTWGEDHEEATEPC